MHGTLEVLFSLLFESRHPYRQYWLFISQFRVFFWELRDIKSELARVYISQFCGKIATLYLYFFMKNIFACVVALRSQISLYSFRICLWRTFWVVALNWKQRRIQKPTENRRPFGSFSPVNVSTSLISLWF